MKTGVKFLIYAFLFLPQATEAFWPFTPNEPQTPQEKITVLENEQALNPEDPETNYNLGVALYKNKQFDKAKINFERAIQNSQVKKYGELEQRCHFNAGNSGYQQTLKMLPKKWEDKETKVPEETLKTAIDTLKQSIDQFTKFSKLNPHPHAEKNKKKAEELLKKLEEKQKEQKQEDKKDEDKKDDKQKKSDKQDDQKDKESKDKEKVGQDQNEGDKDQRDGGGQQGGNRSPEPSDKRDDQSPEHQSNKDKEHGNTDKHDQPPHASPPQPSQDEHTQTPKEKQENKKESRSAAAQQQKQDENVHNKSMQALLDSLDTDANKAHKDLLLRKAIENEQPLEEGQKPW